MKYKYTDEILNVLGDGWKVTNFGDNIDYYYLPHWFKVSRDTPKEIEVLGMEEAINENVSILSVMVDEGFKTNGILLRNEQRFKEYLGEGQKLKNELNKQMYGTKD